MADAPDYTDFLSAKLSRVPEAGRTTGIGSELYVARKLGRRAVGCELKPSYWRTAVANMRDLDAQLEVPSLFDGIPA